MQREKMKQQEDNNKIVEPLQQANDEVKKLKKKKILHDKIMGEMGEIQ